MPQNFDLGIIGAGPAGYSAAFQARIQGLSVVMFEKDKVGGVCLNRGCIPTKAILYSAEVYEQIKCACDLGVSVENVRIDYPKVVERKNKIVEKLRKSLELSLKNAGVTVINKEASVFDGKIFSGGEIYECKKILLATGSRPKDFEGLRFDHKFILNSDDILELEKLPKNILIIGSGAIGIEWSRIFNAFNVDVSIAETQEHLLPSADIEVSKRIERMFKSKNIKMYLKTNVEKIENKQVILSNGEILTPEVVLLCAGRISNKGDIGDASGKIQLAHFAIKQAIAEISGIEFDETLTPSVVYGCPEIAWIGLREQDLETGSYQKSFMLISALGKSHCDNSSEGFIKILSRNGKIIGAHIISKEASALIQQITIAMQNNIAIDDLKKVCFAHPTYSEGIFESLFKLN